jgi:hypothetical protein
MFHVKHIKNSAEDFTKSFTAKFINPAESRSGARTSLRIVHGVRASTFHVKHSTKAEFASEFVEVQIQNQEKQNRYKIFI